MNSLLRRSASAAAVWLVTACSDGTLLPSSDSTHPLSIDATVCAPSACVAACAKGSHNVSSIRDGCEVWECCVLDDAGAPTLDARIDACVPTGCTASCGQGTHNLSRMVDGCEVWDCCVPDDAGAPPPDAQTGGALRHPGCPARVPSEGEVCTAAEWLECEYEGDEQGRCATIVSCESGRWHLRKTAGCGNDATCPASYAAVAQGAACPDAFRDACVYGEATCGCTRRTCGNEPGFVWSCGTWSENTDPACDLPGVRLGDACTTPRQTCWYNSFCSQRFLTRPSMACSDGYWVVTGQYWSCPSAPACP